MIQFITFKCLRCDYSWQPRIPDPKKCPQCKSAQWQIPWGKKYLHRITDEEAHKQLDHLNDSIPGETLPGESDRID